MSYESHLYRRGAKVVAGIDEAGRGPLAGPVVAAAVVLPSNLTGQEPWLQAIDDSKRLTAKKREVAFKAIFKHAAAVATASVSASEIDRIGIGKAVVGAMLYAANGLLESPDHLLIDYVPSWECPYPYQTLVKGDSLSFSIAAASIVAKVTRDRIMEEESLTYPGYGFAHNRGYGTLQHREQLAKLGPCPIHRRSFSPLRQATFKWEET